MAKAATFGRRRYLVAYDIGDDGRRSRIFNALKANGHWVQYSIFLCDLSDQEKIHLMWELEELMDFGADRIMLVDLGIPGGRGTSCFQFLGPAPELPSGGVHIV